MASATLGHRARIGIVLPSTNTSVEPEMAAMQPIGVSNHIGRMIIANRPIASDADFAALVEELMESQTAAIDGVMSCAPDHLVLGLSSETFWDGVEAAKAQTEALRARLGIGVSAASEALIGLLAEAGIGRIAVLTPYQPVGDRRVKEFLEASGIEVTAVTGLRATSPTDIARFSRRDLALALGDLAKTGPQAIVQVGTNLPMARLAREAFDWLGLPVIAANTALYRDALRQLGLLDEAGFAAEWLPL